MTRRSVLPALLGSVLLAVYMSLYLASPITIDGEATLAVATSLVKYGSPDIAVMGAAEGLLPPESRMGSFGLDGHLYAKKGVLPSLLLLPLVILAQIVPGLSASAAAMLLNSLVLTATTLLLYLLGRRLEFPHWQAVLAGLIYGLGSFALAYSQTLFGEPLAALLLLVAVYCAFDYRESLRLRSLISCGLALGLLVGINLSYALLAPLLGLYCFGLDPRRWRPGALLHMALPFVTIVTLFLFYNLARFGSLLDTGYHFAEGEGFNQPFGLGVFGLWLSPYRGIFWYCPVLLLGLWGVWRFRDLRLRNLILVLAAAQTATYASWWSWHGGFVWGPRFLLPVLPLLILFVLPPLQQQWGRITAVALTSLSVLIQLPAVLFDFVPYTVSLYDDYALGVAEGFFTGLRPEVYLRPDLSPILGQIRVLLDGSLPLRPALLATDLNVGHLLLIGVILAAAGALWRWHTRPALRLIMPVLALALLGTAVSHSHSDAEFEATFGDADQIIAASTEYGIELVNLDSRARIVTTNAPTAPDDPLATGLWARAMQHGGETWFITWFPPASPENWQEHDLWQHASFVRETNYNGDRALLFDLRPPPDADQLADWQFGPLRLDAYGLSQEVDGLRLSLRWSSAAQMQHDLSWFVHLLDPQGQIVLQQDRPPQGGFMPTSGWERDTGVEDHLYFPLQADLRGWGLRIGVVSPDGQVIPPNNQTDEDFILLSIE